MLAWQDAEVITVQVDPFGSDTWRLDQIVDLIKNGGVGVIPTDTVYVIAIPFLCLRSVSFPTVDMVRHGKLDGLDVRSPINHINLVHLCVSQWLACLGPWCIFYYNGGSVH
jgi:hypothetical protein